MSLLFFFFFSGSFRVVPDSLSDTSFFASLVRLSARDASKNHVVFQTVYETACCGISDGLSTGVMTSLQEHSLLVSVLLISVLWTARVAGLNVVSLAASCRSVVLQLRVAASRRSVVSQRRVAASCRFSEPS